jgi:hypothetical protein
MASDTEIVNAALRKIGGRRITSIDDTVSSAGVARDVLDGEREDLLRRHPWNFAVTRVQLALLVAEPVFEYDYAFALPSDFLRVISVHDSDAGGGNLEYKIEGIQQDDDTYINGIITNTNICYLRYVRNVTDPNLMTSTFRQVLTLRLAMIFATGIANSNSLNQLLKEDMKEAMRQAASIDGIEDFPEKFQEGSWVTSRHRSDGW